MLKLKNNEIIPLDQIIMIEANGKTSIVHTIFSKFEVNYLIGKLEEDLEDYGFVRVNKFYLVNTNHILAIINNNDNIMIKLSDYTDLFVSNNYIKNFEKSLLKFSISA